MRIAVLSDTHDNVWKLAEAMPHLADADLVLHCGDIISPFMIKRLGEGTTNPVHLVWGNNDGDKRLLSTVAANFDHIHLHGDFAELDLDGFSVALNHYPEIGRALAASGQYDLVCYGHDHTAHEEWVGETLLLNPGEVMGLNGRSTLALYTPSTREVEWIDL